MNILFFLTPKAMCAYIESDDTLRQAMERMEHSGYAALPYWTRAGNTAALLQRATCSGRSSACA